MTQRLGFLTDDETVIWTGAPDWSRAKKKKTFLERKGGFILFGACSMIVAVTAGAAEIDWLGATATVISLGAFLMLLTVGMDSDAREIESYVITNRRLIFIDAAGGARRSFAPSSIHGIHVSRNGLVHDVTIKTGSDEFDFATLFATPDVETLEKHLVKHFLMEPRS